MTVSYPKSMPDDYRRNLWDLECLIEAATHYPDEEGGPDVVHMTTTPERADAIAARLNGQPRNVLIVQTANGRFQIEVGDVLRIISLGAHSGLSVQPTSSNIIEVRSRNL
jgi:hypothetical protein